MFNTKACGSLFHRLFLNIKAMKNLLFLILLLGATSCDQLLKTMTMPVPSQGLSTQEIVEGLKTALKVGTDSSVAVTSRMNGYYLDKAIKIMLPPEADIIYQNKDNMIFKAAGINRKIEEAVVALNRAAEDAASEAGPIFKQAIMQLSITDGIAILRGNNPAVNKASATFDSTAATAYLRSMTYQQLRDAFAPKIKASLNKKLVGNYSPAQIWNNLTTTYNGVAGKSFGMIKPVENTDLSIYVTGKALDGLFFKVGQEEIRIRRDPLAWAKTSVGDILSNVFGEKGRL